MRIFKKISQFSKHEIDTAFKQAHRVIKHDGLILLKAPGQKEYGRILIIASKKVGNAPERNKLKRQIKAIFFEQELFKKAQDWIIILKPTAKEISFDELKNILTTHINV